MTSRAPVRIRPAKIEDIPAITEIYNQGIRGRNATFETEERTVQEREDWLANHDQHHPVLVALTGPGEQVAGWVSADSYRPRYCYRGIAEFSIYIHNDAQRQGVGVALLDAFIPACDAAGIWKLVSRIFPENTGSRSLLRKTGFKEVGVYEKHSYLEGVWRDVIIVERLIPANITEPPPE